MNLCPLLLSRALVLIGMLSLAAAPRTKAAEPPHPVLTIPGTGSTADTILANYTEEQFLRFVPEWAPRDPNYSFAPAVVPGDTGWSWNIAAPDQLTSTPSGTVFPNNAYPILYEPVPVLSGKTVNVPYYLAAGSSTKKSMVFGAISFHKRAQLRKFFDALAPAYVRSGADAATRNNAYARRIAIALDKWANYVPDAYLTLKNNPVFISAVGFTQLTSDIQRYSDHNGMAHEWSEPELYAFDAIYDSPALDELSLERGYDVRAHIATNLFGNIGDYIRDRIPIPIAINTNLSGSFTVLAKAARVLNRPDYILWMGDYCDATVRRKILRDGALSEGISYSVGYLGENLDAVRSTRDYFLTRAIDTPRLEQIFIDTSEYVKVLEAGTANWHTVRLPNGQLPPFGDTNFNANNARNAGSNGLLPAYGHLSLGGGSGSRTVQLNQNFSDEANHMRADVTAYSLWANGVELLGNVRYHNGSPGRQWTEQILAHNAVTIDRVNMSRSPGWNVGGNGHRFTSGNLALYEPLANGLGLSELDGQRPYANKASRYQRILLLNTVDPDRPYVVDVFRVTGGTTHDYTFHGSIRFDATAESSLALTPMSGTYPLLENGEVWTEPTSSGSAFPYYGFFRNVNEATAGDRFYVTYRDTNTSTKRDVRLWMTGEDGSKVYVANTPVAERQNGEPSNFYKYWRPSSIVRHRIGSGSLESLYASVVEPMAAGTSNIAAVSRLPLVGNSKDAVALRVWFKDGRYDTYMINLRNPKIAGASTGSETISTPDGEYSLTGRVGAYISRAAGGSRAWTVAATNFKFGAQTLTNAVGQYSGNIIGITRELEGAAHDAFIVDAMLPAGTALQGRQLSLTFGDYQVVGTSTIQSGISEMFQIDRIEYIDGKAHVIVTADPQLRMSGSTTTELVAPERTFNGPNTFEIALNATAPASVTTAPTPPDIDLPPPPPPPVPSATPKKAPLDASSVTASAWSSTHVPANSIDGNFSTRWAGRNDGVWIRYDLGAPKMIDYVKIAWHIGTSRTYTFDIQISLDGTNWTEVITRKTSSGTTLGLETYDFPDTYGRYVRFVGHMSSGDAFSNITEFEIWADDRVPAAPPVANPAGGSYTDVQSVTLASPTANTSIRYTVDGSAPTPTSGTLYTQPVAIGFGTTTLKAIAFGELAVESGVMTAVYQIAAPLTITRSGYTLNRRTNTVTQRVTLTNDSSVSVAGPIHLVLDDLSANTVLTNASGTAGGSPYIIVSDTALAVGASVSVTLQFTNPASGGITYNPRTVSGVAP